MELWDGIWVLRVLGLKYLSTTAIIQPPFYHITLCSLHLYPNTNIHTWLFWSDRSLYFCSATAVLYLHLLHFLTLNNKKFTCSSGYSLTVEFPSGRAQRPKQQSPNTNNGELLVTSKSSGKQCRYHQHHHHHHHWKYKSKKSRWKKNRWERNIEKTRGGTNCGCVCVYFVYIHPACIWIAANNVGSKRYHSLLSRVVAICFPCCSGGTQTPIVCKLIRQQSTNMANVAVDVSAYQMRLSMMRGKKKQNARRKLQSNKEKEQNKRENR